MLKILEEYTSPVPLTDIMLIEDFYFLNSFQISRCLPQHPNENPCQFKVDQSTTKRETTYLSNHMNNGINRCRVQILHQERLSLVYGRQRYCTYLEAPDSFYYFFLRCMLTKSLEKTVCLGKTAEGKMAENKMLESARPTP